MTSTRSSPLGPTRPAALPVPASARRRRRALPWLLLLAAACARPGTGRAATPDEAGEGAVPAETTRSEVPGDSVRLTIRLAGLPAGTPAGATVHVAGTFNGWDPAAPGSAMALGTAGGRVVTVTVPAGAPVEFKFTLGSWETVETDTAGDDVPNRRFLPAAGAPAAYEGRVAAWRAGGAPPSRRSTRTASVQVLDTAFAMPQLGRTRRVWLYLPPDYATSGRRYPVIYMQDGQNVFDAATSYAGEWGVDETLDSLHRAGDPGAIVVAVDHGGRRRNDEYHPWPSARFGGGEGDAYLEWLVRTLKPYVDARFRTRADRASTAIVGSSSGGLIAFYAGLRHPEIFGRVGAFSPAFLVSPAIFALARAARPLDPPVRIYMASGLRESVPGQGPDAFSGPQRAMADTLIAAGFDRSAVRSLLPADGAHSEWFWRREFPAAYRWLFDGR